MHPLISLIGPDGSGKTRIANELSKRVPNSEVVYMGRARNNIIPINKIANKIKKRKPWMYILASPIYFINLLIKWLLIFPKRFSKIIITDRYITDIYLMENIPYRLRRLYLKLTPKPSYTFYLYNDVSILQSRRPYHNPNDLIRQMNLFEDISAIKIKNDDIEATLKIIMKSL